MGKGTEKYESISFLALSKEVNDAFFWGAELMIRKYDFVPDFFIRIADQEKIALHITPIQHWEERTFDETEILTFLGSRWELGLQAQSVEVCLVTDGCFLSPQKVQPLRLTIHSIDDIQHFIEDVYPIQADSSFFDGGDILFFLLQKRILTIIHHEGYILHIDFQRIGSSKE